MFSRTAQYYDLIYSFKDYEKETRQIVELIEKENPSARSILDVACGTGEHAKHLSPIFEVDGIDLSPEFVDIARSKIPSGRFWTADMSGFDLGVRYDVVQCLFSSIGYLTQPERVVHALVCFRRHLKPDGVVFVEPWFTPGEWKTGRPSMLTMDQPDLKICRMNTSGQEGTLSKIHFHYLIGTPEKVTHLTEDHELALYTQEEMFGFFGKAGLAVSFDPVGLFGRGLYVARADG